MKKIIIMILVLAIVSMVFIFYSNIREYDSLISADYTSNSDKKMQAIINGVYTKEQENNYDYFASNSLLKFSDFTFSNNYLNEDGTFSNLGVVNIDGDKYISVDYYRQVENKYYPCPIKLVDQTFELDINNDNYLPVCREFKDELEANNALYKMQYDHIISELNTINPRYMEKFYV